MFKHQELKWIAEKFCTGVYQIRDAHGIRIGTIDAVVRNDEDCPDNLIQMGFVEVEHKVSNTWMDQSFEQFSSALEENLSQDEIKKRFKDSIIFNCPKFVNLETGKEYHFCNIPQHQDEKKENEK